MQVRDFAKMIDERHPLPASTEERAGRILGAARETYRGMGAGLPEAVYHDAFELALDDHGLAYVH